MCTRRTGTRISCPFSIPPNRILGLERFIRLTPFPATTGLPMQIATLGLTSRFMEPGRGAEQARLMIAQQYYFRQQRLTLKPGQARAQANHSDLLLGAAWNPNGA